MTETDKFSLCQAKRYRAEVFFKEVGSSSFVSVGLVPSSASPEAISTYFLYDFSIQHSSKGRLRQTFPRRQKASVACGMEPS